MMSKKKLSGIKECVYRNRGLCGYLTGMFVMWAGITLLMKTNQIEEVKWTETSIFNRK